MNNPFQEYKFINGAKLKNKFVLAPMTTYSANDDLTLSKEEEIYFNARAKQFGMVITSATAVSKNGQAFDHQVSIMDERYLVSMMRLATAIKSEGAKAIVQLHHGGRMNQPGLHPNQDIVSASAVKANRDYAVTPRALEKKEIYNVYEYFTNATKLAIRAGFDGIELHGANTYLLQQFFSPNSNRRDDEFGGSKEKRIRFILELVDRVTQIKKEFASKEFIIGYRFSPEELEEPGITLEDTLYLVDELSKKELDYLHVSLGRYDQTSLRDKSDKEPIITKIQRRINHRLPVIGVGRIESLEDVSKCEALGYDLFAIGFPSLADPKIIDHLQKGEKINREISKESLVPNRLYNKLRTWVTNSDRGFTVK
jgi:2,4-dienoyl-CoA reductase-like NADH-dependent reductase (Old Yellow Enzyme family)